jgi:DNA polymerase elongation subunit (family B)
VSYRNIYYDARERCINLFTWDEDGKRIKVTASYDPYLYIESGNGDAESIFGTKLVKKTFRTQYERYKYIKDTGVKRVFDNLPATQQYLVDTFWKSNETPEFSQHPIKVLFVDIETYSPDEFPNPQDPTHTCNVITVYDSINDEFITFGLNEFNNKDDDVTYIHCLNEHDLFKRFVEYIEKDYPDIISGWNSEFFDLPYIINRCERLLGEEWRNRLSPSGKVYSRSIKGQFGADQVRWYIEGISLIDYLDVYKRFTPGVKESYKLDAIGAAELGEKKVDFGNMNLATLADQDWQTFVEYNIQDVRLLKKLEEKLKYTELIKMLAYVGLTSFEAALGSLSVINGATAVTARYRNQKIPSFIRNEDTGKNPGAYVGEPRSGFQENIVSFDANSLYPNVMISLNMSPETKVGKIEDKNGDNVTIRHVNGKTFTIDNSKFIEFIKNEDIAISKANVLFSQKKQGVMPTILDFYYSKRVEVKKELNMLKKQYSVTKDKAIKTKIDQLDSKQLCIKVFINSIYGYFGNKHAPFGDDDIASSITLTGQSVIKQSNELLKQYVKSKTGIEDTEKLESCVVYNDTDSSYISIKLLIDNLGIPFVDSNNKLTSELYKEVQDIEDYLNEEIKIWGVKTLNSKDCRFIFKREAIADVGIFLQKKRYVLHILDDEGIPMDKYKYTGVEVVRSTMPEPIKPHVKGIIETMLSTQSITKTNELLNETYRIFKDLPIEDITFVSGLKGYENYARQCDGYKTAKGMPIHAKAAYYYNMLLKKFNIENDYETISSGDKVRYFYIQQPNPYNISCLAYKYYLPDEFKKIFFADYDKMFQKNLYAVIERFYDNVNWSIQQPGQACQTDLFDLLS